MLNGHWEYTIKKGEIWVLKKNDVNNGFFIKLLYFEAMNIFLLQRWKLDFRTLDEFLKVRKLILI